MALHRDILWIGRQWAVTGHGLQLIDQKLQGFFDIEAGKLWDDDFVGRMRARDWLNAADFDKALAVARARYPLPPGTAAPERRAEPALAAEPITPPPLPAPVIAPEESIEPQQAAPARFALRFDGHARFVRPWRVWTKG